MIYLVGSPAAATSHGYDVGLTDVCVVPGIDRARAISLTQDDIVVALPGGSLDTFDYMRCMLRYANA